MDDALIAGLQTATISTDVHSTYTPHPHYSQYKQHKDGYTNQEVRRRKILESQKSRRRDFMDYSRLIVEGVECEMPEDNDGEDGMDEVDAAVEATKKTGKGKKRKKRFYPYRNQLMMSEWLVEVPEDFTDKWLMFVCPIGKRCLVVAAKGTTSAYSRTGIHINNFPSLLPGGCRRTRRVSRDSCILDCIFYETTHTFYVLDVMSWGGHAVYDSDTEFRSFWKATKIRDNAENISKYSRINPMSFIDLPGYPCTKEALAEVFTREWPVQVDGLLFVHKEAHYWAKRTPLATWLKANMVTDILGIPVSQEFLSCAPVLSAVAMEGVERESKGPKKAKKRSSRQVASMEVTTETPSQQGMEVATTEGDDDTIVVEQIEH